MIGRKVEEPADEVLFRGNSGRGCLITSLVFFLGSAGLALSGWQAAERGAWWGVAVGFAVFWAVMVGWRAVRQTRQQIVVTGRELRVGRKSTALDDLNMRRAAIGYLLGTEPIDHGLYRFDGTSIMPWPRDTESFNRVFGELAVRRIGGEDAVRAEAAADVAAGLGMATVISEIGGPPGGGGPVDGVGGGAGGGSRGGRPVRLSVDGQAGASRAEIDGHSVLLRGPDKHRSPGMPGPGQAALADSKWKTPLSIAEYRLSVDGQWARLSGTTVALAATEKDLRMAGRSSMPTQQAFSELSVGLPDGGGSWTLTAWDVNRSRVYRGEVEIAVVPKGAPIHDSEPVRMTNVRADCEQIQWTSAADARDAAVVAALVAGIGAGLPTTGEPMTERHVPPGV